MEAITTGMPIPEDIPKRIVEFVQSPMWKTSEEWRRISFKQIKDRSRKRLGMAPSGNQRPMTTVGGPREDPTVDIRTLPDPATNASSSPSGNVANSSRPPLEPRKQSTGSSGGWSGWRPTLGGSGLVLGASKGERATSASPTKRARAVEARKAPEKRPALNQDGDEGGEDVPLGKDKSITFEERNVKYSTLQVGRHLWTTL